MVLGERNTFNGFPLADEASEDGRSRSPRHEKGNPLTLTYSLWVIVLVTLVCAGLGPVAVMYLWIEYGPSSSADVSFAKLANVPRRHLERRVAWQKRCSAAYDARVRASEAFVTAARWEERGPRAGVWLLAASHPASLAYLAAQYPDGPPVDKLRAIAHGVENGEAVVLIS
jgi:hypothetical protein